MTDAIRLAALQLVTVLRGVDVGTISGDSLSKQVSTFLSAQIVYDAVVEGGMTVASLVVGRSLMGGVLLLVIGLMEGCLRVVAGCHDVCIEALLQEAVFDAWLDLRHLAVVNVQREYIARVKRLPEYGATFYAAEVPIHVDPFPSKTPRRVSRRTLLTFCSVFCAVTADAVLRWHNRQ